MQPADMTQSDDVRTDDVLSRARRLTPGELRLLSLAADRGLRHADLAEVLGASRHTISATVQRIRRKLAVPRSADLMEFVVSTPGLRAELLNQLADPAPAKPDRRQMHLLRTTIDELVAVAVHARKRADQLERANVTDDPHRVEELWVIRRVADIVDEAIAETRGIARRSDAVATIA